MKKHILIVDDEKLVAWSIQRLLVKRGCKVEVANHIPEALDIISRMTFDLVITDYLMPDGKGSDVVHAVRSTCPSCRVIVMSGAISQKGIDELKADGYMEKPFILPELLALIERVCPEAKA